MARSNFSRYVVFFLTFGSVVAAHITRESWWMVSVTQIKFNLRQDLGLSESFLGAIDFCFLALYACSPFISGVIADKVSTTRILFLGMLVGMGILLVLAVLGFLGILNQWVCLVLWGLQGLCQGCIVPLNVTIMSHWFSYRIRSKIMGIWSANAAFGNILGAWITTILQENLGLSWPYILLTTGLLLGATGLAHYWAVQEQPEDAQEVQHPLLRAGHLSFYKVWRLEGVALTAFTFSGVKLLTYSFSMWMPYYFEAVFGMPKRQLARIASTYDVGTVLGSVLAGYLASKVRFRSSVVLGMIVCAVPLILAYGEVTTDVWWLFFFIVPAIGLMVGGSYCILGSAVAADLAGQTRQKATVIGIINGCGSLGAGVGQSIVRVIQIGYVMEISWQAVFMFLISIGVASACVFSVVAVREIRKVAGVKTVNKPA